MCVLVSASGTWTESACCPDKTPVLMEFCNRAAMRCRLMEQACGCSLERGVSRGGQPACECTYFCAVLNWRSETQHILWSVERTRR